MAAEPAAGLKLQIRSDLAEAMRDKRISDVSTLRCMLAAIDDAEAVATGILHDKYQTAKFGDPSVEVPRKILSLKDLQQIVQSEIDALLVTSAALEAAGRQHHAASLLRGAETLRAYLR